MQGKIKKITFVAVLLIGALFLGFGYFEQNQNSPQQAQAQASSDPLKGWAWSSNIGWVSFNSEDCDVDNNGYLDSGICNGDNATIPVPDYKVELSPSGNLNGYAWSSNIGWIIFDPAAIGSSPEAPNQTAQIDTSTGLGSGWLRACNVFQSGCSGALKDNTERGGWDGWIKMAGSWTDGVKLDLGSNIFSGFAWGGDVIGWLNFYNVGVGALPTPQCSDGADNDSDGAIDMADPGCSNPNDNDETDILVGTCSDGIDNDADCLTDGADPGCGSGITETPFNVGFCLSTPQCSDGIDNDGDGTIDYPVDSGCTDANDNSEFSFTPTRCEINPRTGVLDCP